MEKSLHGIRPEFRAPPPSPMGFGSELTENIEDELSGFLQRTVRIPTLSLPDKVVPRKKAPSWNPPVIDLCILNSKDNEGTTTIEMLKSAAITYGCFQIVNHGINVKIVETMLEIARKEFSGVSMEEKEMRRDNMWGFEIEREEGGEDLKAILSHEYKEFCAKMEDLQSQMEEIASNIAQILLQNSTISTFIEEERNNRSFLRICNSNSREKARDSIINHEVLQMLVRDTKVSRALSLHVYKNASEFRVYSKKGQSSCRPLNDAIVITIGNQIQEWSNGLYKNVTGKPIYPQNDTSIEFLYSHSGNTRISHQNRNSEKTISITHQVIITACLAFMYRMIVSLLGFPM